MRKDNFYGRAYVRLDYMRRYTTSYKKVPKDKKPSWYYDDGVAHTFWGEAYYLDLDAHCHSEGARTPSHDWELTDPGWCKKCRQYGTVYLPQALSRGDTKRCTLCGHISHKEWKRP